MSLLAGGTAGGQLIAVIASPALTRLYSATDFGVFQLYASILSFLMFSACWRFDSAVLLPKEDEVAINVLILCLCCVGLTTLLVLFGTLAVRHFDIPLGKAEPLRKFLWILSFSTLGAGTYLAVSAWALRKKSYGTVAVSKLTQSSTMVAAQLTSGFFGVGPLGLVLADALGRLNGSRRLISGMWDASRELKSSASWEKVKDAAVRYRQFPLVSIGSSLVDTAGVAVPSLVLGQLFGTHVLGWFALTFQVLAVPNTLIAQSIAQLYASELARISTLEPATLLAFYHRNIQRLLLLGFLPCVFILLFGEAIFRLVFGPHWSEAGVYARILALMFYASFVTSPLTSTLDILEKQSWHMAWVLLRLTFTVGAMFLAYFLKWSPREAIAAYGLAMIVGYGLHVALSQTAIKRRARGRVGLSNV